jgi:hypothetical protein
MVGAEQYFARLHDYSSAENCTAGREELLKTFWTTKPY